MSERLERLALTARRDGVRVALVSLYDVENNAVRLLAAILRAHGHHVHEVYFKDWISNHLDPATPAELDALVEVLRREEIGLVGLSIRASAYLETARLLTRTVHERTDAAVLWGGMHPTVAPESCDLPDLILQGEGDEALPDLCDRLAAGAAFDDTPNVGVGARRNPLRPLVADLDALPFRDYTSPHKTFIWGKARPGDPMHGDPAFQMLGSRGCVFKCSFCYNSTFKADIYAGQKWYRIRSPRSVIDEILAARAHWPMKRIRFDDEVFTVRSDWLDEFCELYPREVGLPFEIFIEPKLVEAEKMSRLRDAGLDAVNMGVQATERVTGHLYDRRVKNQTVADVAELFHRLGIRGHYQLIFDDPATTGDDHRKLFELIDGFPPGFDLYLFSMTVFPGSELDHKLGEIGLGNRWEVEGDNVRTFYQHRVNLRYPRPVEDTFWIALITLLSKDHVPRPLVRQLAKSETLKKHPWPLIQLAHAANYAKMGTLAASMVARGEMTPTLVRRWLSMERVITA